MEIPVCQVDAFAPEAFQGDPAAVCPLHERLSYDMMQNIAAEEGEEADFVSLLFAPAAGITEDPVTGSAHTMLTPYWSTRPGKHEPGGRYRNDGGRCYVRKRAAG
ncbi:Phenazine biosynthesis-like protein [Fodinibius roseus]|uniref:Phenazine biosynthesis-like protein n=1 Tax=Fodinibius roseus TaxID=1194090 RepID=A0A1M4UI57_9BACT|nr:PhzF family phenazine biosynthesis protein [Fodinibius roseus]SHE56379.1 Phenazine biosynthesis-like protein [Fodinibius roseus]